MGMKKRCVAYQNITTSRGKEKRCLRFVKSGSRRATRQPACPVGMKRGGASPGLMRGSLRRPYTCIRGSKHRK